jgi:hypothetical protein
MKALDDIEVARDTKAKKKNSMGDIVFVHDDHRL